MKTYKTFGRLRNKFGGTLEDLELPIDIIGNGWEFISKIEGISKDIFNRYSMLFLKESQE